MIIFDNLQKCIYLKYLNISKNNEINHGGSQHINEAPHDFSLNFWEAKLGLKIEIEISQFEFSYLFLN